MKNVAKKKKELDKKSKIMERKVDRSLKVMLTQDEILAAGDNITKELNDIDRLNNELASVKKTIGSKIQEAQARADRNRVLIGNKYEYRTVVCTEVKDYGKCRATITRDDTKELVEDRAMTADERQMKLYDTQDENEADHTTIEEEVEV